MRGRLVFEISIQLMGVGNAKRYIKSHAKIATSCDGCSNEKGHNNFMKIMIRKATVEDAKTISFIGVTSWKSAYNGIVPNKYLDSLSVEKREKHLEKSIVVPTNRFAIAELDGQAVGMICFYPIQYETPIEGEWELEAIYILPEYWKRGIGRALIQYTLRYMRENNANVCNLWVLADNQRARGFYEKLGFKYTGIEKIITIGGKDLIEVRYQICVQGSR